MKYLIEWTTEVSEHHSAEFEHDALPDWLQSLLEEGSTQVDGREGDDIDFLSDVEGPETLRRERISERHIFKVEVVPFEPASVGYHLHEAIAVAVHNEEEENRGE